MLLLHFSLIIHANNPISCTIIAQTIQLMTELIQLMMSETKLLTEEIDLLPKI
jgi:hypothetical protein